MIYGRAIPPALLSILFIASATAARADLAPPIASTPYAAIAALAVVIGVITGIVIWRRRR